MVNNDDVLYDVSHGSFYMSRSVMYFDYLNNQSRIKQVKDMIKKLESKLESIPKTLKNLKGYLNYLNTLDPDKHDKY